MTEEEKKAILDKPFGPEETPAGAPEVKPENSEEKEVEVEKPRVPYSRFENVNRARREAEAEAERWRTRAAELEQQRPVPRESNDVPAWWLENYGDTPQTRKAWENQRNHELEIIAQAEERAIARLEAQQREAQNAEKDNLKMIDESLEDLSAYVGRDLTEKEQEAVLDVVDEWTPKGPDGKYLGAPIPFEKAWDYLELKQRASKAPKIESRNAAAQAISTASTGQPSAEQAERDKSFMPGRWGDWRKRLGKEE